MYILIAYTAKLSEVLESEEPFLDRFFPGAYVRAAEMSLQVILLFERVFNNQNQSCFFYYLLNATKGYYE